MKEVRITMTYLHSMTFKKGYVFSCIAFLCFALICVVMPAQAQQSAFDDPGARTAAGQSGDLVTVESKIDAGAVALGSASQVVILMRNDGSKPITSGAISLYPSSNVSANVGENECISAPLPSGAVCAIALSIKGLQPGKFRVELLMRHDGRAKLLTSTVSGVVERSDDASADIISDLDTIPADLDFGTLKDSRPLTQSVILRNVTSKEINIEDIRIDSNDQAGYSFQSDCEKLLSGEACIATVTWAPQQRGPATGVLIVNHDGPTGVVSVILDGEYEPTAAKEVSIFPEAVPGKGLLTASQSQVDFGNGIASSSSITASLVNIGDVPLTIKDIKISSTDSGISIDKKGCRPDLVLDPVEACPLTLTWEPVREGSILDDVQIRHDGARGILVLPITGQADKVVNKDTKTIMLSGEGGAMASIPQISASEVELLPAAASSGGVSNSSGEVSSGNSGGSIDGFKVTSLAKDRAIVSGPGGSRVVFHNQETVIGGTLWRIAVRPNAVEFIGTTQRALLLFDHSLSLTTGSELSTSSTNNSQPTEANN